MTRLRNPHKVIIDTVPVFFFIWDTTKRKIIYVSKKFYELASDKENIEKDFKKYIAPSFLARYNKFINSLSAKNNYTNHVELQTNTALKEVKWIEICTYPVEEPPKEVTLVVGHITDISEKKEKVSTLENENRSFDSMMQLISHDLRQPFTKISLMAELIKMDEIKTTELLHEYADRIIDAARDSNELLQNFLQLAVLNYNNGISGQDAELGVIIYKAISFFDLEIERKKLKVNLMVPKTKFMYPVDSSLFRQAIKNLVSNAIKFTPAGGNLSVKLWKNNDSFYISVTDSGIGMSEKIKSMLFKEINLIRRPGLEGEKSTGLGLVITKRILELHNVTITVTSEENLGSTFTIELPLRPHKSPTS